MRQRGCPFVSWEADVRVELRIGEVAVPVELNGSAAARALAAQLAIPEATARQWARAFAVGGEDAILNGGSRHRTYDYDSSLLR